MVCSQCNSQRKEGGGKRKEKTETSNSFLVTDVVTESRKEKIMMEMVEAMEKWKDRQQQLFSQQLHTREEHMIEQGAREISVLRSQAQQAVIRCEDLSKQLQHAIELLQKHSATVHTIKHELQEARSKLDKQYSKKYQELNEAAVRMEDDFNHRDGILRLKYSQLLSEFHSLQTSNAVLKEKIQYYEEKENVRPVSNASDIKTKKKTSSLEENLKASLTIEELINEGDIGGGDACQLPDTDLFSEMLQTEKSLLRMDRVDLNRIKEQVFHLD